MHKKKTLAISLLMAAGILWPISLSAQEQGSHGGLFGDYYLNSSSGIFGRGSSTLEGDLDGQSFGETNGDITGQTFGDDAPMGSGLFIMLAAGAGYATLKTKKKQNKQNRKEK